MEIYDIRDNFKPVYEKLNMGKSYYWISLNVCEISKLKEYLSLDEKSIEECIDREQPSKITFFDGYIFLVFNMLYYKNSIVTSKELNVFMSKEYIITIYKEELDIIEELKKDILSFRDCYLLKEKTIPCILLYYILDRIILRNYNIISSLEAQADKIEIRILKSPKHEQIDELIHLRRQVYKIRKYLNPLRYIGDTLMSNDNSIIEEENLIYFGALNNKISKLMLSVESLVSDLALVREAFESEIANKTNELMKIFTLIATIFLPLNLLTSALGMNVKGMPFMEIEHGFLYICITMVITTFILISIFKIKKWL